MNVIEKEMINVLRDLKANFGVFEIKAEFEAEGSRMEELMRLKDVASTVGLPIILKIGGAEAVTDIYNGIILGASGLVAPMVETEYAVFKYLGVIKSLIQPDNRADIEFAINIETRTSFQNIDKILALKDINYLHSITFGRSDFAGSLGLKKQDVDSKDLMDFVEKVGIKAKQNDLKFAVGGNITTNSIEPLKSLFYKNLLDKYETRKVVFHASSLENTPAEGIKLALEFELLWLKSKQRFYSKIKEEDKHRILDLEKRLNK